MLPLSSSLPSNSMVSPLQFHAPLFSNSKLLSPPFPPIPCFLSFNWFASILPSLSPTSGAFPHRYGISFSLSHASPFVFEFASVSLQFDTMSMPHSVSCIHTLHRSASAFSACLLISLFFLFSFLSLFSSTHSLSSSFPLSSLSCSAIVTRTSLPLSSLSSQFEFALVTLSSLFPFSSLSSPCFSFSLVSLSLQFEFVVANMQLDDMVPHAFCSILSFFGILLCC